jgi:cysteinyl-tRNA synthetase
MGLKIFNTLSRKLEEFTPLETPSRKVAMYCCGPTVHDSAHIGNFRTFVFADLVRRYLQFANFDVRHVMNITDVEDKIITRVRSAGTTLHEFTSRYEKVFLEDLRKLGCLEPHATPRATEHIPDMIELIERLIDRGLAYATDDGSVYFSIGRYRSAGCQYGQLIKLNPDELRPGERVRSDEYAKDALADFALWKGRVADDGEVFWPSPWGEGRPGWHIECSAMSMKLLGTSFDLHLGGEDLIFPHHEDEIAQSEGAGVQKSGRRFVKYWMHCAHLLVEGKKMSKSLGNYFTLPVLEEKGFTGREVRYVLASAHYRESFNFTLEGLAAARTALARLDEWYSKLTELAQDASAVPDSAVLSRFTEALDNDLNVSAAWGQIFAWVRDLNRQIASGEISSSQAATALKTWTCISEVFGIQLRVLSRSSEFEGELQTPIEIQTRVQNREEARRKRDFKQADQLRDELRQLGWVIEDTPKGPRAKRIVGV